MKTGVRFGALMSSKDRWKFHKADSLYDSALDLSEYIMFNSSPLSQLCITCHDHAMK